MNTHPDFAVVGRGLMGTACARHLAEAGHSVALIGPDEPATPSQHGGPFGSFHDAGRITRRIAGSADWARLSSRSIARYAEIESESGLTFYTPCGGVMAGPAEGPAASETEAFLNVATALDLPHERLTGDALARALPMFTFARGTVAAFDPAGGVINPRIMRAAEEHLAEQAGASIHRHAATGLDGRVLHLDHGVTLEAGHVVLATGAYASLLPFGGAQPKMRVYQRTVLFAEVSEGTARQLANMPSLIFTPEGWDYDLYLLPPIRYPDGKLYLKIGGELDSPCPSDAAALNHWFRGTGNADVADTLEAELRRLMPDLTIEATSSGACATAFTATEAPYIDRVDGSLTLMTGGNGAGAKCADEIGRLGMKTALGQSLADEGYDTDFSAVLT